MVAMFYLFIHILMLVAEAAFILCRLMHLRFSCFSSRQRRLLTPVRAADTIDRCGGGGLQEHLQAHTRDESGARCNFRPQPELDSETSPRRGAAARSDSASWKSFFLYGPRWTKVHQDTLQVSWTSSASQSNWFHKGCVCSRWGRLLCAAELKSK